MREFSTGLPEEAGSAEKAEILQQNAENQSKKRTLEASELIKASKKYP